jgi:hypothetical protein
MEVAMENEMKMPFTVDLGGGWLSRFEAAALRGGDVVLSDLRAGQAARLAWAGHWFGEASVAVCDSGADGRGPALFGVRISSLAPTRPELPFPDRGAEATELLPFAIRLGALELGLDDLEGTGVGTVFNLGLPVDVPDDAALVLAGRAVARGKVVVVGESLGLRLRGPVAAVAAGAEIRTTGVRLPVEEAAAAKDFDFRRPDCVTRNFILRMEDVHREFLRSLRMVAPELAGLVLECADQLTYGEYLAAKNRLSVLETFSLTGPAGSGRSRDGDGRIPRKLVVDTGQNGAERLAPDLDAYLRKLMDTDWARSAAGICLVGIDPQIAPAFATPELPERMAACLRNGWKRFADLRFDYGATLPAGWGDGAALVHVGEHDMVVMAVFRMAGAAGDAWMEVVYPLATLRATPGMLVE